MSIFGTSHAERVDNTQDLIGATKDQIKRAADSGQINDRQKAMLDRHASK